MKAIKAKTQSKKSIARRLGTIEAKQAVEGFNQQNRITGLTNGAFSLISLIDAVLDITGNADVIISTWSAGFYDVTSVNELIESGKIRTEIVVTKERFDELCKSIPKKCDHKNIKREDGLDECLDCGVRNY